MESPMRSLARLLLVAFALGVTPGVAAEAPSYTVPMGIALDAWPYPYAVHYLPLALEGQTLRMAYMDVAPDGAANGRAVLLLHGKNFGGFYWERPIRALAQAGFRVVVPDQIGFGKSAKPDLHYGFDLLAANTIALLDALKIDRVDVIGHSMGGMLAIRFARSHAARVDH